MPYILIVDDDTDLLELVSMMVEVNEMDAKSISNGNEVFSTLEHNPVDLILMDIYLGDKDGRDLSRQIKTDGRYNHIPILLYSAGQITAGSIEDSLADGFIAKPFDMMVLMDRMKGMMQ